MTDFTDDDIKNWGVFAPLSRFLVELNRNLVDISQSIKQLDDTLSDIRSMARREIEQEH